MGDYGNRSSRDGSGASASGGVVQRMPGKRSLVEARYPVQRRASADSTDGAPAAAAPGSSTGLPADLKAGAESLSGMAMDDVRVHYDSPKPAELGAHAYAQGTDIHLGPGQEQHLPHEAWHTVQQKQGRVEPTTQAKSIDAGINADSGLEREADEMGARIAGGGAAPAGPAAARPANAGGAGAAAGAGAGAAAPAGAGAVTGGGAAAGGGTEGAEAAAEGGAVAGPMTAEPAVQLKAADGAGVVQMVKYKTVLVDIGTLTHEECADHIKRFFRLKQNKPTGDDSDYEYASDDDKNLKKRQTELKEADILKRHGDLTLALLNALSTLATATDFTTQPAWDGHNPNSGTVTETFKSSTMAADENTVVSAWRSFLGTGPYANKHPRTGATETGRVMSSDGLRSIRYGTHETTGSKPNQHHYHEETWVYDQGANVVNVTNKVQRVPVT
jgi:hypothetical protein